MSDNYKDVRDGAASAALTAYFDARPNPNERIFCDGFVRAYDVREHEIVNLRQQLAETEYQHTNARLHGSAFNGWQCFHCGEIFTTVGGARDHFGSKPDALPGCMIKVSVGEERGLLMGLRKVEEQLADCQKTLEENTERATAALDRCEKREKELLAENAELHARIAESQKQKPIAWLIPGEHGTEDKDGWLNCRNDGWGEFTRPLFDAPIISPTHKEAVAQAKAQALNDAADLFDALGDGGVELFAVSVADILRERAEP